MGGKNEFLWCGLFLYNQPELIGSRKTLIQKLDVLMRVHRIRVVGMCSLVITKAFLGYLDFGL